VDEDIEETGEFCRKLQVGRVGIGICVDGGVYRLLWQGGEL